MSLKDQILADIKEAMKAKQAERLTSLRFLHAAIKNKEIEVRPADVTDDDVMAVIKKTGKQLKDAIEQYEKAERQDLADKEAAQLKVIETYLPAQMSREELESVVDQALTQVESPSMKQMGAIMKLVMDKTAGTADNKAISEIVRQKLQ